MLPLMAG